MGDHRAKISIRAEFHGKVYEWTDAYINYNGHDGVDQRVLEFFEQMWDDGYRRYQEEVDAYFAERRKTEIEEEERAELARLQAKYAQD